MVRKASSGQEAEQPEGRLVVTGKAPSFSEGSWMNFHFSNYLSSCAKLNIRYNFSLCNSEARKSMRLKRSENT